MVTHYRGWLEKFIAPFPIGGRGAVVDRLVAQSSGFFPTRDADLMEHVRHVTPGDHRNKLKPSTIEQLNRIFADVLDVLGDPR